MGICNSGRHSEANIDSRRHNQVESSIRKCFAGGLITPTGVRKIAPGLQKSLFRCDDSSKFDRDLLGPGGVAVLLKLVPMLR